MQLDTQVDNKNSSILATSKGAKTNNDSAEKPPNNNNKNSLKFNVINKRAIFLFFLIGILLKPVIHFTMFPETEEFTNYNKKIAINPTMDQRISIMYGSGSYYENGSEIICQYVEGSDGAMNCFYYPSESRKQSFKSHLQNLFMQKLWIFAISFVLSILIIWIFLPILENKKLN
jgi:hypothetical protein